MNSLVQAASTMDHCIAIVDWLTILAILLIKRMSEIVEGATDCARKALQFSRALFAFENGICEVSALTGDFDEVGALPTSFFIQ